MKIKMIAALLAGACAMLPAAALAALAYGFTTAPISYDRQLSLGFTFTANVTQTVTSLGVFDEGGDGFLTAHDVGIFAGDGALGAGALLASTTLASGTSGSLGANNFRYQSISGLTLVAGQTYTIAGFFPGDNAGANDAWVYGGPTYLTGFTVNPAITIGPDAARYTYDSGSLVDPGSHFFDYQIYAVNFETAAAVPEPATWAMMIAGFGLVGGTMRRSRTKPAFSAA